MPRVRKRTEGKKVSTMDGQVNESLTRQKKRYRKYNKSREEFIMIQSKNRTLATIFVAQKYSTI
jgi:hypothetical protein